MTGAHRHLSGRAAADLLAAMRVHPLGRDAALIGDVVKHDHRFVQIEARLGGNRIVDWLADEQLPRICEGRRWLSRSQGPHSRRST
jgi:hydrogenase maturation factor